MLVSIRDHAELSRIPIVVLTTSAADEDVLRSYNLRAAGYVTKQLDGRAVHAHRPAGQEFLADAGDGADGRRGMNAHPIRVLMVEDRTGDARLVELTLADCPPR